jgi:predicted dehydrogenase
MSAQVIRFWPEFAALRETLRSGRLGRLRTALFRRRCAAPSWGVWETSGAFDLLIHDVDYTIHLLGMPESISATGVCDDEAGIDILHAHFFYRDGVEALVTGGWHNKGEYPFSMEFTATFDRDTVEYSPAAGRGVTKGDGDNPYAEEIGWFARCCAGEPNDLCPSQQSADAVKLTLFALEARKLKGERIRCTI